MSDIKIARDCYVPREQIKMYCACQGGWMRNMITREKERERVYDFTCGKKAMSVIALVSGEYVLVSTSLETLHARMSRGSDKLPGIGIGK